MCSIKHSFILRKGLMQPGWPPTCQVLEIDVISRLHIPSADVAAGRHSHVCFVLGMGATASCLPGNPSATELQATSPAPKNILVELKSTQLSIKCSTAIIVTYFQIIPFTRRKRPPSPRAATPTHPRPWQPVVCVLCPLTALI